MGNLETYKLKDLGKVVTGSTPPMKVVEYYNSCDYHFYKPGDIQEDKITLLETSESYVSATGFEHSRKLPAGAVLVTCIGTIGKVGILKQESTCNQQINAIIPNDKVTPEFLAYALLSKKADLIHMANAPVVPIINKSSFEQLELSIPDIQTQKKIAEELDLLGKIIALKKEQISGLEMLAHATFVEMFGKPAENDKGWDIRKINTFATCNAGATPSTSKKEYWENGTISWLSSGEVQNGYIFDTEKKISQIGYDSCSTRLVPVNTVLVAMAGQGKTRGTVGITQIPLCTNQSICSIVIEKDVDPVFLYYQLQLLYNELRASSNGDGGRGGLNLKILGDFKVVVPPLPEQKLFVEKAHHIEKQLELIQNSVQDVQTLLDATMEKYFG